MATYEAACKLWPGNGIMLRHGARGWSKTSERVSFGLFVPDVNSTDS